MYFPLQIESNSLKASHRFRNSILVIYAHHSLSLSQRNKNSPNEKRETLLKESKKETTGKAVREKWKAIHFRHLKHFKKQNKRKQIWSATIFPQSRLPNSIDVWHLGLRWYTLQWPSAKGTQRSTTSNSISKALWLGSPTPRQWPGIRTWNQPLFPPCPRWSTKLEKLGTITVWDNLCYFGWEDVNF